MTARPPLPEIVAKLIPRLASPYDGEVSDEAARMRAWLQTVAREPWPNDWTQKFIAGVLARQSLDRLSKKQVSVVNNIVADAYRRGVRVDRSAA
jgi:hypothetical protein